MKTLSPVFKGSVLALVIAGTLSAGPVVVDAGWYGFCFGVVGSPATVGCPNAGIGESGNSTTFTALGPVYFKITDAFAPGDTFEVVIDGGGSLFTPAGAGLDESTGDPNVAFGDPGYSHAAYLLGPGFHTVDIFAASSPFGEGAAYLEVVSAALDVSEPASMLLMGTGAVSAALLRRRAKG